MDEIPEDVWGAAERLVVDSANRGGPLVTALIEPIARAILAERERCVRVALDRGSHYIADAIRRRTSPSRLRPPPASWW